MAYQYLIFDADNTLLDFGEVFFRTQRVIAGELKLDCDEAFRKTDEACGWRAWKECGLDDTHTEDVQQNYHRYYDEYVLRRYRYLLESLNIPGDAEKLASLYLQHAETIRTTMEPNTLEVYRKLAEKHRLIIATNGTETMQMSRLAAFLPYTHRVFVSEKVGAIKPSCAFFDYMLKELDAAPEECLMIGDSMTNDIMGAKQVGIAACYYRPDGKKPENPAADYQIRKLEELLALF